MAEVQRADEDVMALVKDLIRKHHTHLVDVIDQIAVLFKEKAREVGGVVIAGKTSKAPAILKVLGDQDYAFVIEIAWDYWTKLTDRQKLSLLDHHLCACAVEEDEESGARRYFVAPPDVSFFTDEIKRNGFWRAKGSVADEDRNVILDLFGSSPDEKAAG